MQQQPLGILDFGYIKPPEVFAYQVINSLFSEVGLYEELGYKRLWLSEHYSPEFAWYNPEPIIPLLAGYTAKIKIGLAGILLNYHSPLRVAQTFKLISAVFGDRIDLGIARAGLPEHVSKYLLPSQNAMDKAWEVQLEELFSFLNVTDPQESLIKNFVVPPQGTDIPEPWFLASSGRSIADAVRFKANLCLSFMHPGTDYPNTSGLIRAFLKKYHSSYQQMPGSSILVCCAEPESTDEKNLLNAKYNPVYDINPIGTIDYIVERLQFLLSDTGAQEVIIFNPSIERQKRIDFFSRVMEKWRGCPVTIAPQAQSY